jgi:two-component system, cell cycle sensor histidine kinase and response regulator CckA
MDEQTTAATVLFTDDDLGVRTVLTFVLERAGFQVVHAGDGEEAVARVREHGDAIDVVLLDVMMPVMDGREALPLLRAEQPDLPVVFFSGFDRNEVAEQLASSSAYTSFLPKPTDHGELVAELHRAIASRP